MGKYTRWTDNLIIDESKKYKYLTDFKKQSIGAHNAAFKRGNEFYSQITRQMIFNKPYKKTKVKWTEETIEVAAKKYEYKSDFQKMEKGAYSEARRKGKEFFNYVTSHMVPKPAHLIIKKLKYTDEEIIEEAQKYTSLTEFKEKSKKHWNAFYSRGLKDLVTFETKGKSRKYTDEYIIHEAGKYDYASELMKKNINIYRHAQEHGLLSKIKYKKGTKGNLYKRLVYVYEFCDNHFYCGLTYNETKRHSDHMKKGPVFNHMKKTNTTPIKKIVSDGYILCEEAQQLEEETRLSYIENKWHSLNKQRGGGLGGGRILWTEKKIREEAVKFKYQWEFKKNTGGAWVSAKKLGILNEVTSHMKRKYEYDIETCIMIAKKYKTYAEIRNSEDSKYLAYILKKKWENEVCSHFPPLQIRK
jgi:hypothetical protein